jgi:hypothetical protein
MHHVFPQDEERSGYFVECDECGKVTRKTKTKQEAVTFWNIINTPEVEKELIQKEKFNSDLLRGKEQAIQQLCEIIGAVTDNQFICFCGKNKLSELDSALREDDQETIRKIGEILNNNKKELISHLN